MFANFRLRYCLPDSPLRQLYYTYFFIIPYLPIVATVAAVEPKTQAWHGASSILTLIKYVEMQCDIVTLIFSPWSTIFPTTIRAKCSTYAIFCSSLSPNSCIESKFLFTDIITVQKMWKLHKKRYTSVHKPCRHAALKVFFYHTSPSKYKSITTKRQPEDALPSTRT